MVFSLVILVTVLENDRMEEGKTLTVRVISGKQRQIRAPIMR